MSDPVTGNGQSNNARLGSPRDPIAIIGIGCRFPGGANSPESFWHLLINGVNAISEVPAERWDMCSFYNPDPHSSGTTYTRRGGFLDQIDKFDAAFFGISPREAASMDPQQRLLLEVAWEAIEDSCQAVDDLSGSKTGVFVGISTHDYSDIHVKDIYTGDGYTNSGGALSIAANRLSYSFNFRGPSMAVDTACSSSLVAVHLACRSLWGNECELALAGGVNCIIAPETTVGFSHANMLSPDGLCRTFDASANGYVRSEGAGVVLLKPLAQAIADGDPVYAVILATAVNQDGHTHGLTVPSQEAQSALLRDVYAEANIAPERVLYVEAHGTGTPVGDPVEANAIGSVLGVDRLPANFLRIGSVKTNIGHLEAASGVAGLIKAALLIKHRTLPPNLHFSEPNPRIPFEDLRLQVQQTVEAWPERGEATVVGVNSFGFGGTNAHAALDQAPAAARPTCQTAAKPAQPRRSYLLPLSGRSAEALPALAKTYADFVDDPEVRSGVSLADLCHAASTQRSHHEHRLALAVSSLDDVSEHLEAFIAGESRAGTSVGRQASGRRPPVAFVFSGMGPQWSGMGRQLLEDEPVFRAAVKACDDLFRLHANWSLLDELTADAPHSRMDDTEVAQPANFALQVGLTALWRSWGITPDAIVGHSAGEVAAAHAAGILSLEDAVCVIFNRSRLQQQATGKGRMLAVGLSAEEAAAEIDGDRDRVSLAAINSPKAVTLSGDPNALEDIARALEARHVFARFIDVAVPFHSHHMDPLKVELLETLAGITPGSACVPFYSVVTGKLADGTELDASYWWQNVRQPVRFAQALDKMLEDGFSTFLELSPHPVLARAIVEVQAGRGSKGAALPSLRRDADDRAIMLASLGSLYTLGCLVDWKAVNPGSRTNTRLPSYPWQRERYWDESEISATFRLGKHLHPLLERRIETARPVWETHLKSQRVPYLADHRIQGAVVYPAAAYVEMALAAGKELGGEGPCVLEDVEFRRPLLLPAGDPPVLQLTVDPPDGTFSIHGHAKGAQSWTLHATGKLARDKAKAVTQQLAPEQIQRRSASELSGAECYSALNEIGLEYGRQFQGIERLWLGTKEALGRITFPADVAADVEQYRLHPAVLDACFQVLSGAAFLKNGTGAQNGTYFPVRIGRLGFLKPALGPGLWTHARLTKQSGGVLEGDFTVTDDEGDVVVEITGFRCQLVQDPRTAIKDDLSDCLYDLEWYPKTLAIDATGRQADYLPSPARIVAAQADRTGLIGRFNRKRHYEEIEPQIEKLCAVYALEALQALGWKPVSGQKLTVESLVKRLGVAPHAVGLLTRLLTILCEDGLLAAAGAGWQVAKTPEPRDLRRASQALSAKYSLYEDTLALLKRSGSMLPALLRGESEAPPQVPTEESVDEAKLFDESPYNAVYSFLVEQAVKSAVGFLPENRTIRVLEIGAGAGGTTAGVLHALPANRTEYVFSDVSNALFVFARQRFGDYAFVDYQTLDIGSDPEPQGFLSHSFDLILVADGLAATKNLPETLANIQKLLASDGLLVALEPVRSTRVRGLVNGRLEASRTSAADTGAASPRCQSGPRQWEGVLAEAGFVETAAIADSGESWEPEKTLLLARGPHLEPVDQNLGGLQSAVSGRGWLIFADRDGLGADLAGQLDQPGDTPVVVSWGSEYRRLDDTRFEVRPESPEDLQDLLTAVTAGQPPLRGIVHLWSLDAPMGDDAGSSDLDAANQRGAVNVLHLVQALARLTTSTPPRLWLVTSGVQNIAKGFAPGVIQSALWGLGRVITNEHPHLRCTLVDLDSSEPNRPQHTLTASRTTSALLREILADDAEQEICLRPNARYVSRLIRSKPSKAHESKARANAKGQQPFQLEIARRGSLDSLVHRERRRKKPGVGEVEVEVYAAGLNFRDVMKAMGLYPSEEGDPFWLGDECAGKVVRVGPGVGDLQVGDPVVAIAPGSFSSYVTIPTMFVVRKPAHISFEQAAAIPTVFLTTHYALNHLARISASDRVLIHAAAGGVGLAAVQLVKAVGAEIFATAGSPDKRDFLASLGIKHLMDSRSLAFADETMRITGGKGVSVILNSLAGDFILKSISLLEPTGRFLELGKVDLYQNSKLGLWPFRSGLSFFTIDMGWLLQHRPELCRTLLAELMTMFENRTLEPLPVRTFPIADATKAFRFMAQARHIGKIVLSLRGHEPIKVAAAPSKKMLFRADATYLITGGLGGFGLAVAQWMVDQGARRLVLAGRSGVSSPEAEQAVARMRQAGAIIDVAKVDVSREHEVTELVARIERTMTPLRGVFHAAMVVDDGYLLQLNAERFQRVMAPKAGGAWNLHRATLGQPLDYFVLFSSVASWFGSVGQGNYAAANAFLDSLAQYRRARKLPALTINWGAIADVGYIARHPDVGRQLDRQGVLGLKPREATALLGQLLQIDGVEAGVIRLDFQSLAASQSGGAAYRRFSHLLLQQPTDAASDQPQGTMRGDLFERLRSVPLEEQQPRLESMLRRAISGVLGIPASRLDPEQELRNLGFDSLMSVELEAALENELGVDLPMGFLLGEEVSVRQVSQRLLEQIRAVAGGETSAAHGPSNARHAIGSAAASIERGDSLVVRQA